MNQSTRIILKLEHPLRWHKRPKLDHALLMMAHIALIFNWLFVFQGILPILGIVIAAIFAVILRLKNNILAQKYTAQLAQRVILSFVALLGLSFYTHMHTGLVFESNLVWSSFGIILAVLSVYDTAECMNGRLGLRLFTPIKEAIQTRKN